MPKPKNTRLSVFKGREARLNRAIFQTFAFKGTQTIYDIYKTVRTTRRLKSTRYSTVNKRVRALEEKGYITRIGYKKSKAGFEAAIYGLSDRAHLAILLDSIILEDFIEHLQEITALTILAAIISNSCF